MADQYLAYIGTYTTGGSEGIYTYRFLRGACTCLVCNQARGVVEPNG